MKLINLFALNFKRLAYSARILVLVFAFLAMALFFFFNLLATYNSELQKALSTYNLYQQTLPSLNLWVIEKYSSSINFMLVFFIPLITASSITEERKQGTLMLLSLNSISNYAIIFSNFIAYFCLLLLLLILSYSLPAILYFYAEVDLGIFVSGILSSLLLAGLALSISIFMSVLFSQSLSAILGAFTLLLLLYMLHTPVEGVEGILAEILRKNSLLWQTRNLTQGIFELASAVYFISSSFLFLYVSSCFLARRGLD